MVGSRTHAIAVIPGDGIGPEVTAEALKVIQAAADGFSVDTTSFDLGAERYLRTGEVLPDSVPGELSSFPAVLLGAVGDPRVPPGVLEAGLLLELRQQLDLYVNLRPAKLFPGVSGPLSPAVAKGGLDVVIIRENTEGLYSRKGTSDERGTDLESATEISVNTAGAVTRIVRYAFELAEAENRKLTLVHKTNVLAHAGGLYQRIFTEMRSGFPSVPTDYQHVDAAALLLASDPGRFSAIVTDNLFGDILSDLAAALAGGIGLVGSGNIRPGKTSIFEPVHGSAPDIAGTGRANPIGAILSASLMLRHLGETVAAERIDQAVAKAAGRASSGNLLCSEVGDLVTDALR